MPVTICLSWSVSGSVARKGSAISRMGLILAAVRAIPDSDVNAPISIPYAAVKAKYDDWSMPFSMAREYSTMFENSVMPVVITLLTLMNVGGL